MSDVFARRTIAPRRRSNEHPIFIEQTYCSAVQFWFRRILKVIGTIFKLQFLCYTPVKFS